MTVVSTHRQDACKVLMGPHFSSFPSYTHFTDEETKAQRGYRLGESHIMKTLQGYNPSPGLSDPMASAWAAEGIKLSDLSQLGQGLVHPGTGPGGRLS